MGHEDELTADAAFGDLGMDLDAIDEMFDSGGDSRGRGVSANRESNFERETGRFRDPEHGVFEEGSPPPDLDRGVDRFRAADGRFKDRSADLFDEPLEASEDDLSFEG